MSEYLKMFNDDDSAKRALLLLPDIWGITNYSIETATEFANEFKMPVFMLDYFYQLTGNSNVFNPDTDQSIAVELMNKMTGEDFVEIFDKALNEITANKPKLDSIVVVGFCFGGRLAYLSGTNIVVKKIVSFYGAGAHTKNYYNTKTPIQALCDARANDSSMSVLSFYGQQDGSISAIDREQTGSSFEAAGIKYIEKIYDTGHAYFQPGRVDSYNQAAAGKSWAELRQFINN